jgi:hypothetical protein
MEAIKRKVRSLLELAAPSSGATEPERATARAMADKLMAKHGLSEADVPRREVAARRPEPPPPPRQAFVFSAGMGGIHINVGGYGSYASAGISDTTSTSGASW